jgi:hypothetical protein
MTNSPLVRLSSSDVPKLPNDGMSQPSNAKKTNDYDFSSTLDVKDEQGRQLIDSDLQNTDAERARLRGLLGLDAMWTYSAASYQPQALNDEASSFSRATFATAPSYLSVGSDGQVHCSKRQILTAETEHTSRARTAGLLVDAFNELDWSGSGMHIQLSSKDEPPLHLEREIARTNRALISSVLCRRVRLARKTMLCHRRFTAKEAFEEVKHLHKLQHSHIVRLVGSYMQRRYLSILTFPVADLDLDAYMRFSNTDSESSGRACALMRSYGCLVSALKYVHGQGIKHMDIKPKNILVCRNTGFHRINVYLTDFGISRTIIDDANTETDGQTGKTEMYCSPEVAFGEPRGRSSDIFSLGCVFAEMLTITQGRLVEEFEEWRTDDGKAFYRNLSLVRDWVVKLPSRLPNYTSECSCRREFWLGQGSKPRAMILSMLDPDKNVRPTTLELGFAVLSAGLCCVSEPPPFCYANNVNRV